MHHDKMTDETALKILKFIMEECDMPLEKAVYKVAGPVTERTIQELRELYDNQ